MRGIYIIPNSFTAANLACGFLAIVKLSEGGAQSFREAAWLILLANIFDMLDGRVARWTKATSKFGVQFDSLADLVAFGVAPGLLMYKFSLHAFHAPWGGLAAFAFVLCGAARLARFNVQASLETGGPSYFFVGCPIPAAASFLAAAVLIVTERGLNLPAGACFVMVLAAAFMMVSTFPYPSMKKKRNKLNKKTAIPLGILFGGVFVFALLTYKMSIFFFMIFAYFLSGPLWRCARMLRLVSAHTDNPVEVECEEKSL